MIPLWEAQALIALIVNDFIIVGIFFAYGVGQAFGT